MLIYANNKLGSYEFCYLKSRSNSIKRSSKLVVGSESLFDYYNNAYTYAYFYAYSYAYAYAYAYSYFNWFKNYYAFSSRKLKSWSEELLDSKDYRSLVAKGLVTN